MPANNHVLVEQQDHILKIILDRPEKKNSLTDAMYADIIKALQVARASDDIRVVLLSGHPDVFSAGNDLEAFLNLEVSQEPVALEMLRELVNFEKPVVAAVCGMAVGIGVTILLHCDLVYAGENTRFCLPFVNLGVVPEAASTLLLPALMGRQRASELLMLGDFFDSRTALECGLLSGVIADDKVIDFAQDKARQLAAKPQQALRLTKQLLNKTLRDDIEDRMGEEGMLFARQLESDEVRQVMTRLVRRQ